MRILASVAAIAVLASGVAAQQPNTTIEGLMDELYASVTREPGKPFTWERLRRITLPYTVMLPQARQSGGQLTPTTVEQFIANIEAGWKPVIGTPRDQGFFEKQVHLADEPGRSSLAACSGEDHLGISNAERGTFARRRRKGDAHGGHA